MDTTIVVSRAGEERKAYRQALLLPSDVGRSTGPISKLSDGGSPISPVFNLIIPESSAPRLKQKLVRLGFIAKELALFELFLRNNSRNSRDWQIFGFFWCVYHGLAVSDPLPPLLL